MSHVVKPVHREIIIPQTADGMRAEIIRLNHEIENATKRQSFSWIYAFIDIIFVATVYAIEQLFSQCGENPKVFLMAAAYFGIMFQTRNHFDVYAFTFPVKKKNEIPRIIVFIVYCLGVFNMTLNIAWTIHTENSSAENHYGSCKRNITYDEGFAASFIASRAAIVVLYLFHYFVPEHDHDNNDELTRNPVDYRNLMMKKFVPILLTIGAMLAIFGGFSPVIIFPLIALIEFFSDRISDLFLHLPANLLPEAHGYQERLGAMFMLVLGETMVGLLFVHYNADRPARTYATVIAGFFVVAGVGMQFFERAQSDVHERSATARHPLFNLKLYGTYVWSHGYIGFFMLIAANGITEVYYIVAGSDEVPENVEIELEYRKITGGLVCVWVFMLGMELLQPVYRANLCAYWPTFFGGRATGELLTPEQYLESVGHMYCKFLFAVKILVIMFHLLLYGFGKKSKGNYFVAITAVIACIPTICDIFKQLYEFHMKHRERKLTVRNKNNNALAHRDVSLNLNNQELGGSGGGGGGGRSGGAFDGDSSLPSTPTSSSSSPPRGINTASSNNSSSSRFSFNNSSSHSRHNSQSTIGEDINPKHSSSTTTTTSSRNNSSSIVATTTSSGDVSNPIVFESVEI